MEQQRLHQEDRVRRALERAQAEPKKKVCDEVLFSLFGSLRHLLIAMLSLRIPHLRKIVKTRAIYTRKNKARLK